MAVNKKLTELTELTTAPALDDQCALVDVSDTTDAASGTTKRVSWLNTIKHLFGSRFAADAGANDTYVATLVPAPAALVTGEHYRFKANTANTGACTINFNSLGAKAIKKAHGGITTDLDDNDIRAGQWVDLVYDGTNMQMQSTLGNVPGATPGAHASTHQNGDGDEISVTGLSGLLADAQTPLTENVQDIVGAMLSDGGVDFTYDDGTGLIANVIKCSFVIAASDEGTALTSGTTKVTFRMPHAMTLTDIRASLSTAQASGSIFTVDVNDTGTTILSTKITIDNTEKTSTTAAAAPVISDSALADDAEITIDIDQVGDGTAKGLKVMLIGTRA